MPNKHSKRYSTSYVVSGRQIKRTIRYHYTPVYYTLRLVFRIDNAKYCREGEAVGILTHCWWGCETELSRWKTAWQFLARLNILLPCVCVCAKVASVISDSVWPHGLQPARLLCPWGFSRQEYWNGLLYPPPGDLPVLKINTLSSHEKTWRNLHCLVLSERSQSEKGYILCDSSYVTFWKKQCYGDSERSDISGVWGLRDE